jgi:hypothetical protein|tara:strand:+ start:1843 stop:2226 length:384 start_codon:yes stop_codon:yes gene_type:complete
MAVVVQTLRDSDFETVIKVTTTSTNSAASILDASALTGASTDPRLSIVACSWSVGSQTDILFDATSDVVALSLNGSGAFNASAVGFPAIANNAGSGISGDILLTNGSASVGFIILKFRKTSGFDNLS